MTTEAPSIDTLTIGQAREAVQRGKEIEKVLGGNAPAADPNAKYFSSFEIVILDRGFVFVGDVRIDGDWVHIANAKNIRRWGTTKGLGELAAGGPLKDTVLDPAGSVRAPLRALIGLIQCEVSSWKK